MATNQSTFPLFRNRYRQTWCLSAAWLMWAGSGMLRGQEFNSPVEADTAICLNTVGYAPSSAKLATIAGPGEVFVIRDMHSDEEVFRGQLARVETKLPGKGPLRIADFSELDRAGDFRIEIPGTGKSADVHIGDGIYNWPFYCAVRAMYLWRCGTEVRGELNGDIFYHDACHVDDGYLDQAGGPPNQRRDGSGGWHDAGDYNKYTVNAAFTVGMMLAAWEHFGDQLAPLRLDIPESENEVPDFLDEVRWELDWLLKMQAADGRVYHKLSTLKFGDFILPEDEQERRYFSPWSSAATAGFVAVMAQGARVFGPYDSEFSSRCLAAAEKSYQFLRKHPGDHRPNQSAFSTGPYDAPDVDDRLWAAAEMWETTGEAKYLRDFEERVKNWEGRRPRERASNRALNRQGDRDDEAESPRPNKRLVDANWDWANVRNLGLFTYLLSQRPDRDPDVVTRVRNDAIDVAEGIVETAGRHPYGRPLGASYYWGCNGTVARQTMNLQVAHLLTREPRYAAAKLDALNHLFGRNPFGRSYVTGVGHRPPLFPHDRRSGGDDVAAPWPGYLVGGPWPRPTDWYDVEEDYRTNETAINWNGALIYALASFVEPKEFGASVISAKRAAKPDTANNE